MGLHDKPDNNPYVDIYRMGKPHKQWKDKDGNHFVYRKDGTETHYLISNNKAGEPKMSLVSRNPVEATKPTNQRYQVPTSRQARTASTQPPTPTGNGEHKFHGNQYTAHGSDVPVQATTKKSLTGEDFAMDSLLKASGFRFPKMKHPIDTNLSNPKNITNKAFWLETGSAPLVGGGTISVRDLTGPGTPSNPVWIIKKPDGEKIAIHGLGLKDGMPTGIDSRGHGNYTATITKPSGEVEVLRQNGSKGTRAIHTALSQVGPTPITSGKKTHPFHGNQYTAHGTSVPTKRSK